MRGNIEMSVKCSRFDHNSFYPITSVGRKVDAPCPSSRWSYSTQSFYQCGFQCPLAFVTARARDGSAAPAFYIETRLSSLSPLVLYIHHSEKRNELNPKIK